MSDPVDPAVEDRDGGRCGGDVALTLLPFALVMVIWGAMAAFHLNNDALEVGKDLITGFVLLIDPKKVIHPTTKTKSKKAPPA